MSDPLPVILIELVLVFGGVLAFAWWQLRSVRRDRRAAAARREQEQPAKVDSGTAAPDTDDRHP